MRASLSATFVSIAMASVAVAGCGSDTPACNPCAGGSSQTTPALAGHDTNPDGIAYPAPPGGYGHTARRGTTPGNIINNFKFLGYVNGDRSAGLKTIALADFYDPCGKRARLVHLSVAALWCGPCNEETDAFVAAKAELASEGVVVIQALSDGTQRNVGATTADLDTWVTRHGVNFTEVLDPALANLGSFFGEAAIPWNADIDPRTMELLAEQTSWAGTVDRALQAGLDAIAEPARYPVNCPTP